MRDSGKSALQEWHIVTCEYPPQIGGVSDYSYTVAAELARAGDTVHVWCPAFDGEVIKTPGVRVHRELGRFSPWDLFHADRAMNHFPGPRRILVQWVPHGYGCRSLNLFFCFWLWKRSRTNRDSIELMIHEPFLPFKKGAWAQNLAALVHRLMILVLLNAASRVWESLPIWEDYCRPFTLGRSIPFGWLPIPNVIPLKDQSGGLCPALTLRYCPKGEMLIGHFGAYHKEIEDFLIESLAGVLKGTPDLLTLFIGSGSVAYRDQMLRRFPEFRERAHATGILSSQDISAHLDACTLMFQPYLEGVNSRRTSMMALLSKGLPVITTEGPLTEALWKDDGAVALVPLKDTKHVEAIARKILASEIEREHLGLAAKKCYEESFAVQRTIQTLREVSMVTPAVKKEFRRVGS